MEAIKPPQLRKPIMNITRIQSMMKKQLPKPSFTASMHLQEPVCVKDFAKGETWWIDQFEEGQAYPVIRFIFTIEGKIQYVAAFSYNTNTDTEEFYADDKAADALVNLAVFLMVEDCTFWGQSEYSSAVGSAILKAQRAGTLRVDFTHDAVVEMLDGEPTINT